ncbi:MAG: rod shape-determining protein MreC [Candidatus Omnitrophica bacterium]|nr:rod shape-determining protein MreC [Candidatus Omnitrophota bacterium]
MRHHLLALLILPLSVVKGVVAAVVHLPELPTLSRENKRLRQELLRRERELAQAREALRLAGAAHALAAAWPAAGGVVATVMGRSPIPTQHTLLLNKGEQDGLSRDCAVADADGVVGRVVDTSAHTAVVLLLTDPESRVAALLERSRESGLLIGSGRGQCELRYLAADADVQEGDRALTAGLGGAFPKGLLLGTVARVVRNEQTGSATAWITPAASLHRVEDVLILPPAS